MDQASLHFCRDCGARKPKDQFHLRQKDDRFGCKGEPTSRCTSCATRSLERRQEMKRKRADDPSEVSAEPSPPQSIESIEQFTTMLHQQAHTDDLCCRARVPTKELAGNEDEVLKVLVGRVWEATGFRFMCVRFPPEGQQLTLSNIRLDLNQNNFIRMEIYNGYSTSAPRARPVPIIGLRSLERTLSQPGTPAEWTDSTVMEHLP
jgi:hypothetical protein